MRKTGLDKRFFETTRGRIVTLLREGTKTVNQLAEELEVSDNAVRGHLLSLERDRLVQQSGVQRGTRKPHFAYALTEQAELLFPKAYDALLNELISVLKQRLPPAAVEEVLRTVGRSLAASRSTNQDTTWEKRIAAGVKALEAIGGAPRVETQSGEFFIQSERCPLTTAVAEHPEVCRLAETLLSEITGSVVRERCDRERSPRCCFQIIEQKETVSCCNEGFERPL
jgi:predicted ArsR family transcriptional regulator